MLTMYPFLRQILPFVYSLKGSAILKTCSSTSRQEFGRHFEEIVVQSLKKLYVDVAACGGPRDRGIDFRGVWRLKSSSMRVIGQCKRYKKRLGPKHIRELEGSLTHEVKETLGIIVSESGYTKDAYEVFMGSVYPMALSILSGYSDDILCWYFSKEKHKRVENSINAKDSDTTFDMHGKSTNKVMLWDNEVIQSHHNIVIQSHKEDIKEQNNHHFPKENYFNESLSNTMVLHENAEESDFPTRTYKHNFFSIGTSKNQSQKGGFSDATDYIMHLENSDITGTGIGTFTMFEFNPVGQKLLPNVVVGVKYRSHNSKSPELFISEQN